MLKRFKTVSAKSDKLRQKKLKVALCPRIENILSFLASFGAFGGLNAEMGLEPGLDAGCRMFMMDDVNDVIMWCPYCHYMAGVLGYATIIYILVTFRFRRLDFFGKN